MATSLMSLPRDILILMPNFLHNIDDYTSVSSTCKELHECMKAASQNTILRLVAVQSTTYFRPSPHFLVAATAKELGNWARRSDANESELTSKLETGIDALLGLAVEHCGLTMKRIRELHLMRFSIINPVTNIIDQCVGQQWYGTPDFWNGGVSDAYTVDSEPHETLFHLAIYGELFGPDFEAFLNRDSMVRKLSVETRLEYIKYCLPDFATTCTDSYWQTGEKLDPRREVKPTGPYTPDETGRPRLEKNHNIALTWVLQSSRWRPHWKRMRGKAGMDFEEDFKDDWWFGEDEHREKDWRQRMWETVMLCQGLDGLGMIRPHLQNDWVEKVKEWREKISRLEREPDIVKVGRQATLEYPFLLGDLRICAGEFHWVYYLVRHVLKKLLGGYVGGT